MGGQNDGNTGPLPGVLRMENWPAIASARSSMPVSPNPSWAAGIEATAVIVQIEPKRFFGKNQMRGESASVSVAQRIGQPFQRDPHQILFDVGQQIAPWRSFQPISSVRVDGARGQLLQQLTQRIRQAFPVQHLGRRARTERRASRRLSLANSLARFR